MRSSKFEEWRRNEVSGKGQDPRRRREKERYVDEYGFEWLEDGNFRDTWGGGEILSPGEAEEARRFSDLLDGPDDTLEEAQMYEEMEAWAIESDEYNYRRRAFSEEADEEEDCDNF